MQKYENWEFKKLVEEGRRRRIPGAEILDSPDLIRALKIDVAENSRFLFLALTLVIIGGTLGTILNFISPSRVLPVNETETLINAMGVLFIFVLVAQVAVIMFQIRISKLRKSFRKKDENTQKDVPEAPAVDLDA